MKLPVPRFAFALAATAGLSVPAYADQPAPVGELLQPDWTAVAINNPVIAAPTGDPLPPAELAQPAEIGAVDSLNFPPAFHIDGQVHSAQNTDAVEEDIVSHDRSHYHYYDETPTWEFGGWIQQGVTFNSSSPNDRFNGPVVTNDRSNEWQMNQLWFYLERYVDIDSASMNWGARVDLLYGTDAELFQMQDGLEESWNQTARFYQFTPLRFYLDYGGNGWLFRVGRWDVPVGFEPFEATETFFYSRSYNFLAQPGSLLGASVTRQLTDELSVMAGIHRGSDQFNDTDGQDSPGFVGGFSWESFDENSWFDAYMIAEEKGPDMSSYHYSLVGGFAITSRSDYAIEWYRGSQEDGQQNEWYGINQQITRDINDLWSVGVRFEWFRDDDGFIIAGYRDGNNATGPYVGNFYALTLAANYMPCDNFALRPELRWDWYDADNGGPLPFDDQTSSNQFLASIDMIIAF